ncbi:hypothetical protein F4778DRAFT_740279 [Xylariomycetidae sp. FL2044]|nr:hypothetical protein F4778DRAFT_740279 [Xylariomycetidae sp. FL2044]
MYFRAITSLLVLDLCRIATASFQNPFRNVTRGSELKLVWDGVDTTEYPLAIHARLLNGTSEYGANSLEVNITVGLNASSYIWRSIPYPLPYLEMATYEVEIRPQKWTGPGSPPVFGSSPYFTIAEVEYEGPFDSGGLSSDKIDFLSSIPTDSPKSQSNGINNDTAIAAGLIVPVIVALSVFGLLYMMRRQKKLQDEKAKQREEMVID